MPRKPVNVKAMKLKPADFPRLSWRVPPRRKIVTAGKIRAATMRPGSRMNFVRSRAATAATAVRSFIAGREDSEVCILQCRRLGAQHRQRLVDSPHDLVGGAAVQVDHENTVFTERH